MKAPRASASAAKKVWRALDDDAARNLAPFRDVLAPILVHSPFLGRLANDHAETAALCLEGRADEAYDRAIGDEANVAARLRIAKQRVALACGIADLTGAWQTMETTARLAAFADAALEIALAEAVGRLVGRGKLTDAVGGIAIIAMGKHGALELNYSSDIDVIVLFDPEHPVFPDRMEALDATVRVTREVVRLMQERDANGYVFRTDLRLRPDPGSMPLALSLAMAENYYETRGQNWERAAWIKARHAAGDRAVSDTALSMLRPFIWRRYLDFAAIADIHSIKRQIQVHRDILELDVPGHNVKLGRGGIREIEFFVQTQQLIAGGRDERLRERATLPALEALARIGWIEKATAEELAESYLFLRDVEHRLQMVDDRQTHSLPEDAAELSAFAAFCGYRSAKSFEADVRRHLSRTEAHYASLFAEEPQLGFDDGNLSFTGDEADPDTLETLARLGFARPADMAAIVRNWHYGRHAVLRSASARERLTELTPQLLGAFARRENPDEALLSFDAFLGGLPAGVQLFALLEANPNLFALLLDVLADAPRMAELIRRRPHVLDAVVEPRFFAELPDRAELGAALAESLDRADDYEDMLNRARIFAAEQRFLVSIRLLGGSIDVPRAGRAYSDLAQVVLAEMLDRVRADFARRHGHVAGGRIAIVAMGRLGSRELTVDSDLDLVFVADRPDPNALSDGDKPLAAAQYEMKLVQKLIAAMNAPTAEGRLYELDFRLRPSGNSGPLATTLAAFELHQRDRAKVWEHLSLTRARPVAGDEELGRSIEALVDEILSVGRDRAFVAKEVSEMRALMAAERPSRGALDVKLAQGGLVDLEFIAQFAVLVGLAPVSARLGGPAAILREIDEPGLVDAYGFLSTVLQVTRLGLGEVSEHLPAGLMRRMAEATGEPDAERLKLRLDETMREVRAAFKRLVG